MPLATRRIVGCLLAVVAGCLFGVNFDPPEYLMDHHRGSKNGIDYAFAHFVGIFITSTLYFMIYALVKGNRPSINRELVLPGTLSGLMWAVGQTSFFVANTNLSLIVSFPIVSTGPGIIANIWGVFVFREVRGARNFILLGTAFALTFIGVALITVSKE
eukprot:c10791_g1_i1.p3 GENE.c10791_g1_i1~~c10791_g1_i1.p3  ORF type:complete len:159 (-),score=35.87 c10791_g1_i1:44-520(-)